MLVLGIESSCDETAVALVRDGHDVVASLVSSQIAVHAPFGGVIPEIAAREHLRVMQPIYQKLLADSGTHASEIDLVAVTQGPGLVGALLVGVTFAKGLGFSSGIPVVPVDHVHAHVHGGLLGVKGKSTEALAYPVLSLVVSGGHTNLYYNSSPTDFELMAHTVDDACGECFDKVAKLLGLPYPGGPEIEQIARGRDPTQVPMPRMVERKAQMEFSYSGLKTFMANLVRTEPKPIPAERLAAICAAFQDEALGQLERKLTVALTLRPEARAVVIAGGVAANGRFRAMLGSKLKLPVYFPEQRYCSDNAAMIAALGYHVFKRASGKVPELEAWDVYSRYPFEKYKT